MTTLGKILAILNLVLSLFVGWLVVVSYVNRTSWHAAFEASQQQVQAARLNADTFQAELAKLRGDNTQLQQNLQASAERSRADADNAASQIQELKNQLSASTAENKKLVARDQAIASERDRLLQESTYYKTLVARRDDQLKTRESENEAMRAKMVEAQIGFSSEQDRNRRLLEANEKLAKDNQRLQQNGGSAVAAGAPRANPPADDIEGLVKAIDQQSQYVTLTIGSDAGLHRGNTLEVYRLQPDPMYLGTIEVIAVRPSEAVAKPVTRMRGAIQVGDRVASKIVTRR